MDYLDYEKDARKNVIKNIYNQMKKGMNFPGDVLEFADDTWTTPLREYTFERKKNFLTKDGRFVDADINLPIIVDHYVRNYQIKLDKDITLEDAINSL